MMRQCRQAFCARGCRCSSYPTAEGSLPGFKLSRVLQLYCCLLDVHFWTRLFVDVAVFLCIAGQSWHEVFKFLLQVLSIWRDGELGVDVHRAPETPQLLGRVGS
jgi:hypothetical protein